MCGSTGVQWCLEFRFVEFCIGFRTKADLYNQLNAFDKLPLPKILVSHSISRRNMLLLDLTFLHYSLCNSYSSNCSIQTSKAPLESQSEWFLLIHKRCAESEGLSESSLGEIRVQMVKEDRIAVKAGVI